MGSEGRAITSFQSNVMFVGNNRLSNTQAKNGGALLAANSVIVIYGETTITQNNAANGNGGGISLQQSGIKIEAGICNIYNNHAVWGGGIHATSSSISIHLSGNVQFINNSAVQNGGGVYLAANPKVYILKERPIISPK